MSVLKSEQLPTTGPLLSAFQCKQSDLLERYIEAIFIPPSVVEEAYKHGFSAHLQPLIKRGFVIVDTLTEEEKARAMQLAEQIASSPFTSDRVAENHLPEAEAMMLSKRPDLRLVRLLVEERAARQIATEENIAITGFIGILLLACEERILKPQKMQALLEKCRQQGTHYGQRLIDAVCQMCEEMWQ